MAFQILQNNLGSNDLINDIALRLHNSYMKDMKDDIKYYPCVIEKALAKDQPLEYLKDKFNAKIFIERWVDWQQVCITFPDINDQFFIWHQYTESYREYEEFLVFGNYSKDDGTMYVDKFFYSGYEGTNTSINDYLEDRSEACNYVPFQFLHKCLTGTFGNSDDVLHETYDSGRLWADPRYILNWFKKFDWRKLDSDYE